MPKEANFCKWFANSVQVMGTPKMMNPGTAPRLTQVSNFFPFSDLKRIAVEKKSPE